jgi:DNA polymerase-1
MKKGTKKRLVLLDAHALLHRAYHALPEFSNSKGVPTGGLYGYISMILRIVADFKPDYIVACYDLPQKTFRHEAYDAYKGKRAKTDEALVQQIKDSRRVCEAFHIPIYDAPGFEADDMLGTIVEQTTNDKDLEIIIATGDMDSLQLVDGKRVRVFTLKKGINDTVVYDEAAVKERYGFGPDQLTDFKGLRGDPSDNIIGVPGVGEKTATDIILKFGTIEKLYKALHKDKDAVIKEGIKERMANLLLEHEESALFSKTLATIRRDAPITFALPEKSWLEICSLESVEPILREFEFKSLIVRMKEVLSGGVVSSEAKQSTEERAITPQVRIAIWLLNSDLTNPSMDDVYAYAKESDPEKALPVLEKEIKEQGLETVYRSIELPLVPVLSHMQKHGVLLDCKFLKEISEELHAELSKCEKKNQHWKRLFFLNRWKETVLSVFF